MPFHISFRSICKYKALCMVVFRCFPCIFRCPWVSIHLRCLAELFWPVGMPKEFWRVSEITRLEGGDPGQWAAGLHSFFVATLCVSPFFRRAKRTRARAGCGTRPPRRGKPKQREGFCLPVEVLRWASADSFASHCIQKFT